MIPSLRQQQILEWLQTSQTLSIDELAKRLGVSMMTVHRDVDQLTQQDQVQKVHGGVRLKPLNTDVSICRLCTMAVQSRTMVQARLLNGETWLACCPHCGLLLLHDRTQVASLLARDFLYGRVINAFQAFYLLETEIALCCVPGLLCFGTQDEAQQFQRGFGGLHMTFDEALYYMQSIHNKAVGSER